MQWGLLPGVCGIVLPGVELRSGHPSAKMVFATITTSCPTRQSCLQTVWRESTAIGTDSRYDMNRDWIVGNLTGQRVDRNEIAAGKTATGKVSMRGWEYTTTVEWDDTLLPVNRSE